MTNKQWTPEQDKAISQMMATTDHQEFNRIYSKKIHYPLRALVIHNCKNYTAQWLFQETMSQSYLNLVNAINNKKINGEKFLGYVFGLVRYTLIDIIRSRRDYNYIPYDETDEIFHLGKKVHTKSNFDQDQIDIYQMINERFSKVEANIFKLFYMYELSPVRISKLTDISVKSVRTLLHTMTEYILNQFGLKDFDISDILPFQNHHVKKLNLENGKIVSDKQAQRAALSLNATTSKRGFATTAPENQKLSNDDMKAIGQEYSQLKHQVRGAVVQLAKKYGVTTACMNHRLKKSGFK